MSDLASIQTVDELVTFISSFIATVPTQEYVDQELDKKLSKEALGELIAKLVYRTEFKDAISAKASRSELLQAVASKAEQSDVSTGIARKANLNSLYSLEAKVNRLFPYQIVDTIADRNNILASERSKLVVVLDATADPQLSSNANGAIYGWSKNRQKWIMQSEIRLNGDQISYNRILGKPTVSAVEIDTAVGTVITNIGLMRRIREVFSNMHQHVSSPLAIDSAVEKSHDHTGFPEIFNIADTDLITLVRGGQMVNVKASVLKNYLKG